jgi:hypothetical protein
LATTQTEDESKIAEQALEYKPLRDAGREKKRWKNLLLQKDLGRGNYA